MKKHKQIVLTRLHPGTLSTFWCLLTSLGNKAPWMHRNKPIKKIVGFERKMQNELYYPLVDSIRYQIHDL